MKRSVALSAATLIGLLVGLGASTLVWIQLNPVVETTTTTLIQTATTVTSTTSPATKTIISISTTTATETTTVTRTADNQALTLLSPAFTSGDPIPIKYTCDGDNSSPALTWSKPAEGTETLVLIMDDPDAPRGAFTHWVVFNIPRDRSGLPEGRQSQSTLEWGGVQGRNGAGQEGYIGPCPPAGPAHTYSFRLYAIDIELTLSAGASKEDVMNAIKGHILAQAEMTGRYGR
jgi:Raf kinase inhibitor-like YbhB/YbcL family protein